MVLKAAKQIRWRLLAITLLMLFGIPSAAFAHCDTLDGPVVAAARQALDQNDPALALIWVSKDGEAEIKAAFDKTQAVRKLGGAAGELADMYFFETLVRVHRQGEGAPYTGLKPAGTDIGPAISAADKALAEGHVELITRQLTDTLQAGLKKQFDEVLTQKNYDRNDVAAGREYISTYVKYMHYVENLYAAAAKGVHGHDEGHQ